jgi:hypothetical protein
MNIRVPALFLTFASGLQAGTISLTFQPSAQVVVKGGSVSFNVIVSGLGLPPEVGSFDLTVIYDPGLLAPSGVIFGSSLGDPTLTALTGFNISSPLLEFAEVSLLPTAELDKLQMPSIVLATINFDAIASGTTSLSLVTGVVDDGGGNKIFTTIPEPGTALCGLALAISALSRKIPRGRDRRFGP